MRQRVRVKTENPGPNKRVPEYVKGKMGIVVRVHGTVSDYSQDHSEDWGPLYSVLFGTAEVPEGPSHNSVIVDIHESWLEDATTAS